MTMIRTSSTAPARKAFAIRAERAGDITAREALLDVCFGDNRNERTCQRLRDGRAPAAGLALSAVRGHELLGTLRLWHVNAGGCDALMLGPLAVQPEARSLGLGAALMQQSLSIAAAQGHRAVILLGDAPYYARFGFSADKTGALHLPGPFERERLLGRELAAGSLDGAWGMILPTGAPDKTSRRARKGTLVPCAA